MCWAGPFTHWWWVNITLNGLYVSCYGQSLNDSQLSNIWNVLVSPQYISPVDAIYASNNQLTQVPNQIGKCKANALLALIYPTIKSLISRFFQWTRLIYSFDWSVALICGNRTRPDRQTGSCYRLEQAVTSSAAATLQQKPVHDLIHPPPSECHRVPSFPGQFAQYQKRLLIWAVATSSSLLTRMK